MYNREGVKTNILIQRIFISNVIHISAIEKTLKCTLCTCTTRFFALSLWFDLWVNEQPAWSFLCIFVTTAVLYVLFGGRKTSRQTCDQWCHHFSCRHVHTIQPIFTLCVCVCVCVCVRIHSCICVVFAVCENANRIVSTFCLFVCLKQANHLHRKKVCYTYFINYIKIIFKGDAIAIPIKISYTCMLQS